MVWLDTVTSDPSTENRVHLEGGDETYVTWTAVEEFLLPETLLSINDFDSDDGSDYVEDLDTSFANLDVSDGTSLSSSHSLDDRPKTPPSPTRAFPVSDVNVQIQNGNATSIPMKGTPSRATRNAHDMLRPNGSSKPTVPKHLRPLFSHILWLIHREINPDSALESYILLTNDPAKQAIAQRFGIKAKRLEQLRDIVAREDLEYRNHLLFNKKESGELAPSGSVEGIHKKSKAEERLKSSNSNISRNLNNENNGEVDSDDEDEDEIVFRPVSRGSQAQKTNSQRVWDPNDFARTNAPRGGRGGRARGGSVGPPRGRGGAARGRGGFQSRGAYVAPGASFRPTTAPPAPRSVPDSNAVLNPDSYDRPPPPRVSGGRGGRRKLWEPN
jgi:hypothetical protein